MASQEERILKFKRNVEALNNQFLGWCSSQLEIKPSSLLSAGLSDYLRHAGKLQLEFSDIISAGDDDTKGSEQHVSLNGRSYAPLLSLIPKCHTKTIHLIRHGEGWHNVGLANHDAQLTNRGWQQAHDLGKHMLKYEITRKVQLVVVSPLMRTLETAAGVFGVPASNSIGGISISSVQDNLTAQSLGVLMEAQKEAPDVRSAHAAVYHRPGIKFMANELCRERLGPSSCDARRPVSESAKWYPGVDFSLISSDADADWKAGSVEPEESVVLRGRQFLQWLLSIPETNIAVVTHSAFLWFTLSGFGVENARPVRERLQRWFENGEMRTVVLGDGGGSAGLVAAFDCDFRPGQKAVAEPQQELMDSEGSGVMVA